MASPNKEQEYKLICCDLLEALVELIDGLDRTNWSSWQTTAHFAVQHEAARAAATKAADLLWRK